MLNSKIAVFLCALGLVGFIVNGATMVQLASFFSIVVVSVYLMRQQKQRIFNNSKFSPTKR